jgi:hypothetical protein
MSGDTADVHIEAGIPADLPPGLYEVVLHLSDPEPQLHARPEYAIRLANEGLWEDSTGYNLLQQTLRVDHAFGGDDYQGDDYFKPAGEHPAGIGRRPSGMPEVYELLGNYPNPFNGVTQIRFYLRQREQIRLDVYNVRGVLIDRLLDDTLPAGEHTISWHPENISTGTYFYRLSDGASSLIGKAIYLK